MIHKEGDVTWYSIEHLNPEPWESPSGNVIKRGGKLAVHMTSPERLRNYKAAVAEEFVLQNPDHEKHEGLLSVHFYLWRQVQDFETLSGGRGISREVDTTNVQKALEDGLQDVLYGNDRDNLHVSTWLQQGTHDPFILIRISPDPDIPSDAYAMKAKLRDKAASPPSSNRLEGRDIF